MLSQHKPCWPTSEIRGIPANRICIFMLNPGGNPAGFWMAGACLSPLMANSLSGETGFKPIGPGVVVKCGPGRLIRPECNHYTWRNDDELAERQFPAAGKAAHKTHCPGTAIYHVVLDTSAYWIIFVNSRWDASVRPATPGCLRNCHRQGLCPPMR